MKLLILLSLLATQLAFGNGKMKLPAKPGIDNNKIYDFNKQPVKYLTAIYMDHHFSSLERGLERVKTALKTIDPLYNKDINTKFHPDKFKHSKVFEIKATLHVLNSMLWHKKGMNVTATTSEKDKKTFKKLMTKQEKIGKLNTTDMMLFAKIKGQSRMGAQKKMQEYLTTAMDEMKLALKIDPKSPTIHYQYAKLMRDFYVEGDSALIEKHLYKAAELSHAEKDFTGVKKSLTALKDINPKSSYIAKLEKLK